LGRKGKEGVKMAINLSNELRMAIDRTGEGSSEFGMKLKKSLPEEENLEATSSGGSGQYSAPLFGDMNEDENEQSTDLTFYKSKFNSDDDSFTAAYKIIDDASEKVIEVLNIQEIKNENRMFFDKKKSYKIKIHKFRLPKSQVKILDDDTGFKGFKFIKIPYWLVKKKPEQFKIIRINDKKRLDNKYNYKESDLDGKVDKDVIDYIKTTDGDIESMRKIKIQQGGEITKAETKEATGASSAGAYVGPAVWAKTSTKKNWRNARKTQIPGGKFVEVRKKCQKFPYCNQGDIKSLKIFENERIARVIKNISKKHRIDERVIKNILAYELGIFRNNEK